MYVHLNLLEKIWNASENQHQLGYSTVVLTVLILLHGADEHNKRTAQNNGYH